MDILQPPDIAAENGAINATELWGRRPLAYPIKNHMEGNYVLQRFQMDPGATDELQRLLRFNEDVIRFNGSTFTKAFDGTTQLGIPTWADLDALHCSAANTLYFSLDASARIGGAAGADGLIVTGTARTPEKSSSGVTQVPVAVYR